MTVAGTGVQVAFNIGGTWTDVTSDVRTSDLIKISGGRRDEASAVTPSTCAFKLNNKNGVYSDSNPRSPYFGLLGRNTPMHVSVSGDATYLALDGDPTGMAQTPDAATLDITGDLDVRFEITTDWYAPGVHTIIGKYDDPAGQRSWLVRLDDGDLRFYWSPDGTGDALRVAIWTLPPGLPDRHAGRCTLLADNGAGGLEARLYLADTLDGPWEQYGTAVTAAFTTSVFASTAPLQIGPYFTTFNGTRTPFAGRGHRFEVRNGIDGPVVAGVDFSTVAAGTTTFTDAAGLPWTVDGTAEVTAREPRFTGEISAWPQRWDVSGVDVWVPITAAGVLRRYGQGTKALQSTLRRRIPSASPAPIAYWPMEEGTDATHAYSPLPGVAPLRTTGMQWAAATGLPSSSPLPTLGQTASLRASFSDTGTGGWQVEMVYKAPDMPSTLQQLWRVNLSGGAAAYLLVFVGNNSIRLETHDPDDNLLVGFTTANPAWISSYNAGWTRMQLYAGVDGTGAAYWAVSWHDIEQDVFHPTYIYDAAGTVPGGITALVGQWGQDLSGFALGHLAVFDVPGTSGHLPTLDVYNGADDAFAGETAIGRMRRLSGEEGLPLRLTGDPAQTELVGPQRVDTILNLIQSAADVDGGLLHEQRDSLTLAYRARHTLYNQPVALALDYTKRGEVMPPLEPTEDDQATRNDVTVTREGGSSAQSVQDTGPLNVQDPPAGVGRYDTEVPLNAYSDGQLLDLAGWRLHLGTWPGARYPSVSIALHAAPWLTGQVLAMRLLDRIQIANPPEWLPPGLIDLLAEGYSETIGPYTWDVTFNCSPAGPWTVGVVAPDDASQAGLEEPNRADTSGSVIAVAAAAEDTMLVVHTPQDGAADRALWVSSTGPGTARPGEFPFDVRVGGEVVRVTGCEPLVWDLFDRTTASGWGIATSGDSWNTGGGATTDYSVAPGAGQITLTPTISTVRFAEQLFALGDCELLMCLSVDQTAVGGDLLAGALLRGSGSFLYWCDLAFQSDGAVGIEVRNVVTPVGARVVTPYTYTPDDRFWLRARVVGDGRVLGRVWPDGQTEPSGWHVDRTVTTDLSTSGSVGVAVAGTGTNANPVASVHEFRIADPQQFTVVRAVNGVVKPQAPGADVRLAQPSIVAL